jgi:hypothetical protein
VGRSVRFVELHAHGKWTPAVAPAETSARRPVARGQRAARLERELFSLMGDWDESDGGAAAGASASAAVVGVRLKPDPDHPPLPLYISLLSDGEDDSVDGPAYAGAVWERYRPRAAP